MSRNQLKLVKRTLRKSRSRSLKSLSLFKSCKQSLKKSRSLSQLSPLRLQWLKQLLLKLLQLRGGPME